MKYIKYLVIALIVFLAVNYYLNRPKKSISGSSPDIVVSTDVLLNEFKSDENAANSKYLDKIIEMEGTVNSINSDKDNNVTILLATEDPLSNISCQLEKNKLEKSLQLKVGDEIKVKGRCTGMLMDVVLVNCVIEKKLNKK